MVVRLVVMVMMVMNLIANDHDKYSDNDDDQDTDNDNVMTKKTTTYNSRQTPATQWDVEPFLCCLPSSVTNQHMH